MTEGSSKVLTDYIVNRIKEQRYKIETDSKKVRVHAEDVKSYMDDIIKHSSNVDDGCITYPSFYKIIVKLNELSVALESVNNRKQQIRDFKNNLYSMNGCYREE